MPKAAIILALVFFTFCISSGCGLLGKKKIEDTDTYKELMEHQKEIDKKMDSVKKENFKQVVDSAGNHVKQLDSLKRITDSLKQKLDQNIQELKSKK